ncbi:Dynamin-1 [Thelohanellus kitauei]|uniref:Dynamin-1 n=1 Tax=Thelohanellus kitauei TaxID=669202 RepID=A0A0C2MJA5_THEKT|nr:Dynamin-1 [Thelohanellus kitauei]
MAQNIDHLISLVNRLQDCFAQLGSACPIDLPQIAVVGEQSAGKSSVLENFVGKDFLPRGSGIVTRCPLVLQLVNQPGKDKKFEDFLEVRREIEAETERMTGSSKNITSVPINLRVYSPNVLNLTLIDLPGLTKVAVGDQPKDIEAQIRNMIMGYINNPNCLILAVTPAVIDLANSESLKMSREVDPDGKRTIGVITKIDMMDQGTDCKEVLDNRVVRLRRGFVGIVNRSQSDILGNKNIKEAQEAEMEYFSKHPQLAQHIKETLPSLKQKIMEQIKDIETNYGAYLYKSEMTGTERTKIFMTLIQEFTKQVDVVLGYQQEYVDTRELSGGSRINQILYQRFPHDLSKIRPDQKKLLKEIGLAIANSQGVRSTIFTPDVAFTSVVKKQILATHTLCDRIVELVSKEFKSYPNLMMEISKFCQQLLAEFMSTAKKHVEFYLLSEAAHINTKHPDFQIMDQELRGQAENSSGASEKKNEAVTYKKGYVAIGGSGFLKSSRNDYLVIRGRTMTSFKDERLSEMRFEINLDGCRLKVSETSPSVKKNTFILFHQDGKYVLTRIGIYLRIKKHSK